MATEEGIIKKNNGFTAIVETTRSSACNACAAKKFCDAVGSEADDVEIEAINNVGAEANDRVLISCNDSSVLKVTALFYLLPVLFLFAGIVIGNKIGQLFNFQGSAFSAITGFLFVSGSFVFIKLKGNKMAKKNEYKPRIIKILK